MSIKRIVIVVAAFFLGSMLRSQTPPVNLISGNPTSTQTNCGTPATPSICIVGTGVFVWQNSTQGWFLVTPPPATPNLFVSSISVNGGPPQSGAVGITVPSKATSITSTTIQ